MKIRAKLIVGFLLILLISAISGYLNISNTNRTKSVFYSLENENARTTDSLMNMKIATLRVLSSTMEYLLIASEASNATAEDVEEDLILEGKTLFSQSFDQYLGLAAANPAAHSEYSDRIREKWETFLGISDEIIMLKRKGVSGQEIFEVKEGFEVAEKDLLDTLDIVLAVEENEVRAKQEGVEAAATNALTNTTVFILASIVLSIILWLFLSDSISKPLKKLEETTSEIAKGDLDAKTGITSDDELGQLSKAVDKMAADLKKSMVTNKDLEEKIAARTNELKTRNQELEKFNELVLGRELKMIELKNKLSELEKKIKTP